MKRKVLTLVLSVMVLAACFLLCSCAKTDSEITKYSVSYTAGSADATGSAPAGGEYAEGDALTIAQNSFSLTNHNFVGWTYADITYKPGDAFTMPGGNVEFVAKWEEIPNISVSFDTDGGEALTPVIIRAGSKLSVLDVPEAEKEGYWFVCWCLDSEKTQELDVQSHVFTTATVLYAKYTETPRLAANIYGQEETTLLNQASDVAFTVISSAAPTAADITLTSDTPGAALPEIRITHTEGNAYSVAPVTAYSEGASYTIEVGEQLRLRTVVDGDTVNVKRINFLTEAETVNVSTLNPNIVVLERTDYLLYDSQRVYVASSVLIDKGIKEGAVLCVRDGQTGSYYKAGTMTIIPFTEAANAVAITLDPCEFSDVYQNLEFYDAAEIDPSEFIDDVDVQAVAAQIQSSEPLINYLNYAAYAVADFVKANDIAATDDVQLLAMSASVDVGTTDDERGFWANIDASKTVTFSDTVYAEVVLDAYQYLYFGCASSGDVSNLFDWHFDVSCSLTSRTDVNFAIILHVDGKTYDIKSKIQNLIAKNSDPYTEDDYGYDTDSFVASYVEKLNLSVANEADSNLFSVDLFEPSIVLAGFVRLSFPVKFNVSVDINGTFAMDFDYTVKKLYGIAGKKGEGVWRYKKDVSTKYDYQFYYEGYIGFKAGVSVGFDLSFNNLECIGRAGLQIEVGAYFDFYGFGSYIVQGGLKTSDSDTANYVKGTGGYYYEYGIYLELSLYFESEIFSYRVEQQLIEKKFKLGDGGEKLIAVGYDVPEDYRIITSAPSSGNVADFPVYNLKYMDLTTGSVFTKRGDSKLFFVFALGGEMTRSGNEIVPTPQVLDAGIRADATVVVRYAGTNANIAGRYLSLSFPYSYLPSDLDISPEDVDKEVTVTYTIDGETYSTEKVKIGKFATPPRVTDEWYSAQRPYVYCGWDYRLSTREPVTENISLEATKRKRLGKATFTYLAPITYNRTPGQADAKMAWFTKDVYGDYGTDVSELVEDLYNFEGDVGTYVKFLGWDKPLGQLDIEERYGLFNTKDVTYTAQYEYVEYPVTVEVAPLYNNVGEIVFERTVYDVITTYSQYTRLDHYYYSNRGYVTEYYTTSDFNPENEVADAGYFDAPTKLYAKLVPVRGMSVTVFDGYGNVLATRKNVAYGTDASDIMNEPAVVNWNKEYSPEDARFEAQFVKWMSNFTVSFVMLWDVEIRPYFKTYMPSYTVSFDPGEGEFAKWMQNPSATTFTYNRNSVITRDVLAGLQPQKASDGQYNYQFAGWKTIKPGETEYTEVGFDTLPITCDCTYVATYTATARTYDVTAYSSGEIFLRGESEATSVESYFTGGETELNVPSQNLSDLSTVIAGLETPTPTNAAYVFSHWSQIVLHGEDKVILEAQYKLADGQVDIVYNLGDGTYMEQSGTFTESISISGDSAVIIAIGNSFEPTVFNGTRYDENLDIVNEYYAYEDENYYYDFVKWVYDDGTDLLATDEVTLTAVSEDIGLTAVYESRPKMKRAEFVIDTVVGESYADGDGYSRVFYRPYQTEFDVALIPEASKAAEPFALYEYVFSYWLCNESKEQGVNDFEDDFSYVAVFEKRLREITVTFDAGANGIFPSTGLRYSTMNLVAGVSLGDFGEEPVYNGEIGYYNYVFDGWDVNAPFTFTSDDTVTARYAEIRNQKPAPDTGITVSNGMRTEDIGKNTIKGYDYNPTSGSLTITEPGLTITSGGVTVAINIVIDAAEVTFKDLSISSDTDVLVVRNHLGEDTVINVEGTVSVSYVDNADSPQGGSAVITDTPTEFLGKGDNAALLISGEYVTLQPTDAIKMRNDLSFNDVGVEISVTAVAAVNVFYATAGTFSTDGQIEISVAGDAANSYAFCITENVASSSIEAISSSFELNGCSYLKRV